MKSRNQQFSDHVVFDAYEIRSDIQLEANMQHVQKGYLAYRILHKKHQIAIWTIQKRLDTSKH